MREDLGPVTGIVQWARATFGSAVRLGGAASETARAVQRRWRDVGVDL